MTARAIAELPSALAAWDDLEADLAGRDPAVFLDYDGTLTPIVARPEDARLDPGVRDLVARLAARCPVAIVSGRELTDVRTLVGLDGLAFVGSHGFDVVDASGGVHRWGEGFIPDLDAAERDLAPLVAPIEGAVLERKRFALTVHFREGGAPAGRAVEAALEGVAHDHPRLRRTGGKMIAELRPRLERDKGTAVRWLLERVGGTRAAVYLGDDETDEDAFRQIHDDGVGIVVRGEGDERLTLARYSLAGVAEVPGFLERLLGSTG